MWVGARFSGSTSKQKWNARMRSWLDSAGPLSFSSWLLLLISGWERPESYNICSYFCALNCCPSFCSTAASWASRYICFISGLPINVAQWNNLQNFIIWLSCAYVCPNQGGRVPASSTLKGRAAVWKLWRCEKLRTAQIVAFISPTNALFKILVWGPQS